jgi:hypothetical protein
VDVNAIANSAPPATATSRSFSEFVVGLLGKGARPVLLVFVSTNDDFKRQRNDDRGCGGGEADASNDIEAFR